MNTLHPAHNGLTPAAISVLVERFYARVRKHSTLGPVFDAAIADWDEHTRRLASFWCSVALRAGTYHGNPMGKHRALPIGAGHFQEWLALWRETAHEVLHRDAAQRMVDYAERIGQGLQMGLGLRRDARPLKLPVNVVSAQPTAATEVRRG